MSGVLDVDTYLVCTSPRTPVGAVSSNLHLDRSVAILLLTVPR